MAVRFAIGRAGSGKTHRCLEAIRGHLRADPIAGPDLILFIPEQAAVQAERTLLGVDDIAGASRYHTLSFRRLQQVVLAETGLADREVVGQIGRQMILQYLLIRNRKKLQVLEKVADRPGTAAKVAAGLVEFMQQGILASHLQQTADQVESAPSAARSLVSVTLSPGHLVTPSSVSPALLAGKLRDLSLLYEEYLQWLSQHEQADPAALLAETAERLDALEWLRGSRVWVDGFASFSAQQRYMLTKLSQAASHVEIALLMDPQALQRSQPPEPHDLFYRTWQTYQQLKQTFEQAGVAIEEPVLLTPPAPPRFHDKPVLAHIEAQIFATSQALKPPKSGKETEFDMIAAPSRLAEVEAVARKIVDLTRVAPRGEAIRYRQIGVIVRDLEPYHDLFQTVFAAHGIPCFIDRRRGVSHHPLVELVRALLRLLIDQWPIDAVASLLKTDLTPIPQDRTDLVENYLLAHGIVGWENWCKGPWKYLRRMVGADEDASEANPLEKQALAKVNYARGVICDLLRDWANPADSHRQTGRDWADRLYKTLERLKVPQRLARWQKLAGMAGDTAGRELGQQHVRVWSLLVQLLDDLVAGLGDEPLDADQFQATIEAGLEAFSLPLIPPVVDQVVIGSVERSRQPEIVAAFVLGFNEGLFPHRASQDVLLSDHERQRITQLSANLELPTGRQRLFDERMLVYIALTRASRYVWLSYAVADESGKTLAPSPYLRAIQMLLPDPEPRKLADPLAELQVADVGTTWQAATGIVLAGRALALGDGKPRDGDWRTGWTGLWHWMREQMELGEKVRRVASACDYDNTCAVRPDQAPLLMGNTLTCSVSQLQEYAACPYRYFAHYGLRLKERPEFELAAVELGSFYHRILYKLASGIRQRGQSLRTVPLELLNQMVHQATDQELAAVVEELALPGGREQYLLERAKADIGAALRGHVSLWRQSQFEPALLEAAFGMKDGLPALQIDTPKGRQAVLRGKIDRIDIAEVGGQRVLTVIDYKRSGRYRFRLDSALAGLQVQLIAYMKAAAQTSATGKLGGGAAIPGGMYYFNILPDWQKVQPGELLAPPTTDTETRRQEEGEPPQGTASSKQWKLKGFTNMDWLETFGDRGDGGSRLPVEMRLTTKGEPYANVAAGNTADFQKVIDGVWRELGKVVDDILDGQFEIKPYKMGQDIACTHCVYNDLCRFAPEFNRFRMIERCGTKQLLGRLGTDDKVTG